MPKFLSAFRGNSRVPKNPLWKTLSYPK